MSDGNDQVIGLLRDVLRRQDNIADELSELKTAVHVEVELSAQRRNLTEARFDALEKTLSEDIKPQTDEFRRLKMLGVGFLTIVAMGGATVGGMLVWAGDTAVNAIRSWLRITGG